MVPAEASGGWGVGVGGMLGYISSTRHAVFVWETAVLHCHIKTQTWCSHSRTTTVFAKLLPLLPRDTKSWLFIYDLSTFPIARWPRNSGHTHKHTHKIKLSFKFALFFYTFHCKPFRKDNIFNPKEKGPACPAHPSLLSPHLQSGTRGSQGVSPLPSQDPRPPPCSSSFFSLYCVCACGCVLTNSKHHRMCYNRTNCPLLLRCFCHIVYSCLIEDIYLRVGVIEW